LVFYLLQQQITCHSLQDFAQIMKNNFYIEKMVEIWHNME